MIREIIVCGLLLIIRIKLIVFNLDNYQNEIYTLSSDHDKKIGEALFSLADTPHTLYIGSTSAVVSLDKQTLKSEVLFFEKDLFTHNYNTLFLDSKRRLWFASDEGCMAYFIDEKRFETYKIVLEKYVLSQKKLVNVIYEDGVGNIWIGTHGNGLFLLDNKTHSFSLYLDKDVLSGDNIRALDETPNGNLLIGTGHGLSMLEKKTEKVINLNSKTGFPLKFINRKSLYVSPNHCLYMGGATGMIAY